MGRGRLDCVLAAPEAVQPLLCDRKAEIGGDGDESFAVALLDPRRHRFDPVCERVRTDVIEAIA